MGRTEIIFCYRKSPEGGYEARAIGESIFTQGETMEELGLNAVNAVQCHFGGEHPLPEIRLVEVLPKGRWLGSAKGEFTVPDDFNDPLPKDIEDLFWK